MFLDNARYLWCVPICHPNCFFSFDSPVSTGLIMFIGRVYSLTLLHNLNVRKKMNSNRFLETLVISDGSLQVGIAQNISIPEIRTFSFPSSYTHCKLSVRPRSPALCHSDDGCRRGERCEERSENLTNAFIFQWRLLAFAIEFRSGYSFAQ